MSVAISKSQIDRLGARLKRGDYTEADLRALDEYRQSFRSAYEHVVHTIREQIKLEPTGRPAKSTTSIVEKLQRETIRLSQIQDIAGCRILVNDLAGQDRIVRRLRKLFADVSTIDRRRRPSHGYRAVHVVINEHGKPIEVQVRSKLQHLWAEVSERLSDVIDPGLKYGGGPADWQRSLLSVSD